MTNIKLSTQTSIDIRKITDAEEWCKETFGPSRYPHDLGYRWGYTGLGCFMFTSTTHEEDAVLFALRWL